MLGIDVELNSSICTTHGIPYGKRVVAVATISALHYRRENEPLLLRIKAVGEFIQISRFNYQGIKQWGGEPCWATVVHELHFASIEDYGDTAPIRLFRKQFQYQRARRYRWGNWSILRKGVMQSELCGYCRLDFTEKPIFPANIDQGFLQDGTDVTATATATSPAELGCLALRWLSEWVGMSRCGAGACIVRCGVYVSVFDKYTCIQIHMYTCTNP